MNHTFDINNYQDLENLFKDIKLKYCKNCQERTYHLKCGFKKNNFKLECLKCQ